MFDVFFTDKKNLVSINEFSAIKKIKIEDTLRYIADGALFPMVQIKSGAVARRIPSLLTEFFCAVTKISNDNARQSLFHKNDSADEIYKDYLLELDYWSKKEHKKIVKSKILPPTKMLPWASDLIMTEPSYVFGQPEPIIDSRYGKSFLPQFVTPNYPRFYLVGSRNEDLYRNFLEADYRIDDGKIIFEDQAFEIGIQNRALGSIDDKKRIFYYPDLNSQNLAAYRCNKHFPITIHLAISILGLEDKAYSSGETNNDKLTAIVDNALLEILAKREEIDFILFNELLTLSTLSDRWVPIDLLGQKSTYYRPDSCFEFNNNSVFIDITQIDEFMNLSGWGNYSLAKFKKTVLDRFKLRNYLIYNKYLYYIFSNIKNEEYKKIYNTENILKYLESCFLDASNDLSNDTFFTKTAKYTGVNEKNNQTDNKSKATRNEDDSKGINMDLTKRRISKEGQKPSIELAIIDLNKKMKK